MVLMLHKQSLFFADAFSKKEKSAEVIGDENTLKT